MQMQQEETRKGKTAQNISHSFIKHLCLKQNENNSCLNLFYFFVYFPLLELRILGVI